MERIDRMRKTVAIILSAMMMCAPALAETAEIGTTNMTVELPETFEAYQLSEDDVEEGVTAHYGATSAGLEMYISEYENDDWTEEELLAALEAEEGTQASGITEINGINAVYRVMSDGTMTYVQYEIIAGDKLEEVLFSVDGDEAKQMSMDVMNSLHG